jgi:hypothetical protein
VQLKKCGSPLLVPFLQSRVIGFFTGHSRQITFCRRFDRLGTAFDTADVVVGIMCWTVSMPVVGQRDGTV